MKRAIFLAEIGKAFPRIPGLSNGLVELGWDVHIITPMPSKKVRNDLKILNNKINVHYSPSFSMYKNQNRAIWLSRKILKMGSISKILKYCGRVINEKILRESISKFLMKNDADFLFTTQEPFYIQKIAANISDKYKVPWIADQLDLWGNNHVNPKSESLREMERKILHHADIITTVSEPLRKELQNMFPQPCYVINGGYLTRKITVGKYEPKDFVRFEYMGQIYEGYQDFHLLLHDFEQVALKSELNWELAFTGPSCWTIENHFQKLGIQVPKYIKLQGNLSHEEAIKKLSSADAYIILEWGDQEQKGILSKKLFEYISFAKPILYFGENPGSELQRILKKTGLGIEISEPDELQSFIRQWQAGELENFQPNNNEIKKYSYSQHALTLVQIFDEHKCI